LQFVLSHTVEEAQLPSKGYTLGLPDTSLTCQLAVIHFAEW